MCKKWCQFYLVWTPLFNLNPSKIVFDLGNLTRSNNILDLFLLGLSELVMHQTFSLNGNIFTLLSPLKQTWVQQKGSVTLSETYSVRCCSKWHKNQWNLPVWLYGQVLNSTFQKRSQAPIRVDQLDMSSNRSDKSSTIVQTDSTLLSDSPHISSSVTRSSSSTTINQAIYCTQSSITSDTSSIVHCLEFHREVSLVLLFSSTIFRKL